MNNILVFTDWFLPGYKAGGPIRSLANLVAHLKGDFSFQIVTRNSDYQDTKPYNGIIPDQWTDQEGFSGYYLSHPSYRVIKKIILDYTNSNSQNSKSGIRNPEYGIQNPKSGIRNLESGIIYINGIWSFWFSILPLILAKRHFKGKIIVAPRGMLSTQTWASSGWKKKPFLFYARLTSLYKNVVFHVTSESEMEDIMKFLGNITEVVVIPNLPRLGLQDIIPRKKQSSELHLISIARIAPEKNTQFMLEILQFCKTGNIQLDLYGPVYNQKYWEQCQEMIQVMPPNIQVNYHGPLDPENIDSAFEFAHFLFMPSRGENFGHTILESLQHGVPVILSDTTPWKDLTHHGIGWDLPLDRPDKFVEIINYCLQMNQEIYDHYSSKTQEYLAQIHNLDVALNQYRNLFTPITFK